MTGYEREDIRGKLLDRGESDERLLFPASSYWLTSPEGSYHQSEKLRTIVSARRKLWEGETAYSQKKSHGRTSSLFQDIISTISLIALVFIGSVWLEIVRDIVSKWVLS